MRRTLSILMMSGVALMIGFQAATIHSGESPAKAVEDEGSSFFGRYEAGSFEELVAYMPIEKQSGPRLNEITPKRAKHDPSDRPVLSQGNSFSGSADALQSSRSRDRKNLQLLCLFALIKSVKGAEGQSH